MEAGADVCILEPAHAPCRIPEATAALSYAHNTWQAEHWLDSKTNWHERWRGSICVAIEDPEGGAREIEKWAGHPYMAQVLIKAEPRPSWGDPKYDPIWAAATKNDIRSAAICRGASSRRCRSRRWASPATTTTSWSATRCWPPTR